MRGWGYQLIFWHTKRHLEVDFVLYGKKRLIAIEVKSGSKVKSSDLEGLLEFKNDYPISHLYLVYGGVSRAMGDVHCLNIEDFLINMDKWLGA